MSKITHAVRAAAIAVASLALTLTVAVAAPTGASAVTMKNWERNSGGSYTGAIYHCAKDGRITGRALVVERGNRGTIRCKFSSKDKPYGIKVWQPKNSCLTVQYYYGPGAWVTKYRYSAKRYGRDVWVKKGSYGGTHRTKIVRCKVR